MSYYSRYDRLYSPYRSLGYSGIGRGSSWSEYLPIRHSRIEYVPEPRVEYRPVERRYLDYIEVRHEREYVPIPRIGRRVDYVPIERFEERVDYVPLHRSRVVRSPPPRQSVRLPKSNLQRYGLSSSRIYY